MYMRGRSHSTPREMIRNICMGGFKTSLRPASIPDVRLQYKVKIKEK